MHDINFYLSPTKLKIQYPCFILKRSRWDDFSYKTTFIMEFKNSESERILLGEIKIAQKNQSPGETELPEQFTRLDSSYFSIGQSKNFYDQVEKLPANYRKLLIESLNDLRSGSKKLAEVKDQSVVKRSLLRSLGALNLLEKEYESLLNKKTVPPPVDLIHQPSSPELTLEFKCKLQGSSDTTTSKFEFSSDSIIPGRINVLVGKNGTGKTQLLANLVGAVTGIGPTDNISESRAKISKVFAISYSVFDKFFMPNDVKIPNSTRRRDFLDNQAKYDYIGIREKNKNETTYRVIGSTTLSRKFVDAIKHIDSKGLTNQWRQSMKPIFDEAEIDSSNMTERMLSSKFKKLGAGHKVSISILTCLFAKLAENSLVVMDEPENHLHPSLVSSTIHALRTMLEIKNSYAIISTHSPIVVQETPSKYIHVITRIHNNSYIRGLPIESFGTSLDTLAGRIFGIHSEMPDYRNILKDFAEKKLSLRDLNSILGHNLSPEASSYFVSIGGDI